MPHDITDVIGPLMKAGRLADGIDAAVVMTALGVHDTTELKAFEDDHNPDPEHIKAYAAACRAHYDRSKALHARAAACREQYYASDLDNKLTNHVQLQNRPVRWWWARRTTVGGGAPLCYICNEHITPLRLDVNLNDAERDAIHAHRADHLRAWSVTGQVTPIEVYTRD